MSTGVLIERERTEQRGVFLEIRGFIQLDFRGTRQCRRRGAGLSIGATHSFCLGNVPSKGLISEDVYGNGELGMG